MPVQTDLISLQKLHIAFFKKIFYPTQSILLYMYYVQNIYICRRWTKGTKIKGLVLSNDQSVMINEKQSHPLCSTIQVKYCINMLIHLLIYIEIKTFSLGYGSRDVCSYNCKYKIILNLLATNRSVQWASFKSRTGTVG